MFTIMDNRKRARLEMVNTPTQPSNECLQGVATSTNSLGSATLATIGGQSFILSNTGSSSLPANILLSICDDNSDESEEYIIDSSVLQQIKQENSVATQTAPASNSQLLTTIPQYRIINQSGKTLNNTSLTSTPSSTIVSSSPVTSNSTLIPTSMQLSSGCEIYVIKEVIEPPKQLMAEPSTPHKTLLNNNNTTTIKLEPMSPSPAPAAGSIQIMRSSTATSSNKMQTQQQQQQLQHQQNKTVTSNICQNSVVTVNSSNTCNQEDTNKRSLILEAYKKRDDKRRATHNEVERRRRDKINSWIFKLKEMLPSDVNLSGGNAQILTKETVPSLNTNANTASTTARLLVQQGSTTTRTPPSDSKSQILIKACEYIKTMQEEIQSLRECLTENDNLRLSNQRLQEELNNLRNKQQRQHLTINNNNSIHSNNNNNTNTILLSSSHSDDECELTLNSLNTTYANVQLFSPSATTNNHLSAVIGPTTTATTSNSGITYAKRELIIRDYVD